MSIRNTTVLFIVIEPFAIQLGLSLNFCNILRSYREGFIFKQMFQTVTGIKKDRNLLKTQNNHETIFLLLLSREREINCSNK